MALPSSGPTITGTNIIVSSSYTLNSKTYPVRGRLWVPTSLPFSSIDVVVAYHGTIETPGATIGDASAYMFNVMKNKVYATDKIIFSVAYPQDHISVAQNLNLLTQTQLDSFYLGDNLPYAQAALLWAKDNLNTFMSSNSISKTINNVYMFGHSQGGSLVHKLNTLVQTSGVVANAPGPIRLDETCAAGEAAGSSNTTCSKLYGAYGTANSTPLSSNQYFLRSVENYVTGHLAPITYTQALDDTTGYAPGVLGQVGWMTELLSIMQTNSQAYSYYTVSTGGHGAYENNTYLQGIIRTAIGSTNSPVPLSFSQISTEFGTPSGKNLGAYRVSQTVSALTNMPLDAGIPQSGEIKFSDFYSKKLNVVVDYTSPSIVTRVTGRSDYDANNSKITVIGNFRQRPSNPAGTKVWIHTNGDIGSDIKSNTRSYASLLSGNWDVTTDLRVDIGPSGRVFGAGGNGGNGGNADTKSLTDGSPGNNGTSAIGINIPGSVIITNRGRVQCGGGGGGAAWALHTFYRFPDTSSSGRQSDAGGGGGGGGAGYPAGDGGSGGTAKADNAGPSGSNLAVAGSNGNNGALLTAGAGGPGGTASQFASQAFGGAGGNGESDGTAADGGGAGSGNGTDGNGGSGGGPGGQSGYSIVANNSSATVTITNTGTLVGDIAYNTTPS